MAAKLTEITTQYHKFVDNQVLTKDQLNEFINYFEDQDRLSRIFLSGVGIVCGFELNYDASKPSVTISQGVGVTTDGDLINLRKNISASILKSIDLQSVEYSWFKKFEDNFANYRFFKRLKTVDGKVIEEPIDLWELLPEKADNAKSLSTLANLKEKVVLLYLESYSKEGDLCTAIDCDNQGVEQVARLRILLVSKTDAEFILGLDSIFTKHNVVDAAFKLPKVAVRRIVINKTNTVNYDELKRAYYLALNENGVVSDLKIGISSIVKEFGSLLKLNISSSSLNVYFNKLKSIAGFSAYNVPFDVQYRYDCVKDLVDTYNEIRKLLWELKEECFPDIKAFPKHLMLGSLDEIQDEIQHYRHEFYKSSSLNCGTSKIEQCRSLVLKWFQLVLYFKTSVGETKITPSNKLPELSNRSIPFYFDVQKNFLTKWNYFKTKKLLYDTNLCYHTSNLSSDLHIREPLNYNIDGFDFYRIEGHQGKDYQKVMEEIDALKTKHGLAFDVKALSINVNSENLNIDDYECEFEDLNVLLRAWTAEQDCVLGEVSGFFSGFSVEQPGINIKDSVANLAKNVTFNNATNILNLGATKSTTFASATKDIQHSAAGYYRAADYAKENVVEDNLTTKEGALGVTMKTAFIETKGGSVNDIIAKAENLVAEKVNTDAWKELPEVKDLVIDKSIELMAYSHVLSQKMPGILADVSVVKVDDYKLTLKELCSRVDKLKTAYQTVELSANLKALMGVLITQLSSICCSAKKLEVLLEEINKRKEGILLRLQLAKFVEKHPGLEHKAGVEPGGTFVLVYLNKVKKVAEEKITATTNRFLTNFNEKVTFKSNITGINLLSDTLAIKDRAFSDMVINDKLENIVNLETLNRLTKITELPNNTVVADFALPYMCCSDCAPVNFIVQRPPVLLRLEKDHFCLGQDTSPLIFDVSPADGVIKADQEVAGVTIDGNKLSFDPETFPNEMFGKTIHFTVNDQITQAEITVYRAIQFDFSVPESPTSQTEITFVPNGNLEGATFLWSFGDDNLSTDRNPTHQYSLPVNEENKVTVSLTVTAANGICQNTVEHEIEFRVEPTSIALEKDTYCENDENRYPFNVTPAGAEVNIEGNGVEKDADGGFVFIPAIAGAGIIEFMLNGTASGLKVTVNRAPVAKFTPKQVDNLLVITNNSTGADSYIWLINGKEMERDDASQITIELTPNSPREWKIQLRAISKNCGVDTSQEVTFITKLQEEVPVNTCVEETKAAMITDLRLLRTLDIATSEIVHSTWLGTSRLYGGTAEFTKGVLNDADNYLSGKNNGNLQVMFEKLLNSTAKQISTLNPVENKQEFNTLVQLFQLQLQLFYNILGCQDAETIKASADLIQSILEGIIGLLRMLKNREIVMPPALRSFILSYTEKVQRVAMLVEHLNIIRNEKLI